MSAAKYTPGPWRLDEIGNVESEAVHNIAVVFSAAGQVNWGGSDFDTLAHCEANARLIAAAPELLEALKGLVVALENIGGEHVTGREGSEKRIDAAYAAIEKAEGGAA